MAKGSTRMTRWAAAGAILAGILSGLTLLLPPELGGYNVWNDVHLVVHNLVAILTRIVVFALIGAALAGTWHHKRRRAHRNDPHPRQRRAHHAIQGSSRPR